MKVKTIGENRLTPIEISGVIVPVKNILRNKTHIEYKLKCDHEKAHPIETTSQMRNLLNLYRWKEVRVVGLLNESSGAVIPQKILPKGSDGESSNIIDFNLWKNKKLTRKVINKINDLVIVPSAVLAVLVS